MIDCISSIKIIYKCKSPFHRVRPFVWVPISNFKQVIIKVFCLHRDQLNLFFPTTIFVRNPTEQTHVTVWKWWTSRPSTTANSLCFRQIQQSFSSFETFNLIRVDMLAPTVHVNHLTRDYSHLHIPSGLKWRLESHHLKNCRRIHMSPSFSWKENKRTSWNKANV